jgi:hypothetical protein
MATEKDFTPADWEKIEAAPFMAGLAVTYGDLSSKAGIADEAHATGTAIKAGSSSSSEIVRALAARFAEGHRPTLPKLPNQPAVAQEALIEGCKQALALVIKKAPDEAPAFSTFLLDVARAASAASREGGAIGIGVRKVSEGEERALAALALALS